MSTSKSEPIDVEEFEVHRRRLTGLAYRMLGSVAEAEDVVQEAYLRWHAADRGRWPTRVRFSRRSSRGSALDQIKSARSRREHYIGPWLPEPVVDDEPLSAELASDYAHELSMTLMLALERLSPLERAAFLLHDVFDVEFGQVARTLGRSEPRLPSARRSSARTHVKESQPPVPIPRSRGSDRRGVPHRHAQR